MQPAAEIKPFDSLLIADLQPHAAEAAQFLRVLANEHRLLVLCHLLVFGEMTVTELVGRIGLSQSALSQHLARLRDDGLVAFRRESQTLHYRVCDARAARVLAVLKDIFCPTLGRDPE
ncbi:helix-turn-helix transcriptional regulator [Phenylobacterium sp.]|uniref:ArsR/SmtB family transcription factor n=1 Tax=Phenylobacterium sp. TaxID=1871053 RepID=UPI002604B1D3|nr:metalloregulator ArsR/SmtB family transcription factor [Phenylobacterium sp.]